MYRLNRQTCLGMQSVPPADLNKWRLRLRTTRLFVGTSCVSLSCPFAFLDLPSDMPGVDARRRMSNQRCKPCTNPHDRGDMPKHLPAGLTQYVLNNFSKKSPPYHVTEDDVSTPLQRLELEKITGHQSVREPRAWRGHRAWSNNQEARRKKRHQSAREPLSSCW